MVFGFGKITVEKVKKLENKRDINGLIKALNYKNDWIVRNNAAQSLGIIGDSRAAESLLEALNDDNAEVQKNVVNALGNIGDIRAVEPLIQLLNNRNKEICENVIDALGKIGDPSAVEPIINALKDEDYGVRYLAAVALGRIGDSKAVEPLIQVLNIYCRNDGVIYALGEIGDSRAVEPLIKKLPSTDAIGALGKISDPRAVEPLINLLDDEDKYVRFKAAEVLIELYSQDKIDNYTKKRILQIKRVITASHHDEFLCVRNSVVPDHRDYGIGLEFTY